jgi:DNA-directed RNA polymerase subunit H (RpoH/RPB5)
MSTDIEIAVKHVAEMLQVRGEDISEFLNAAATIQPTQYYSKILDFTTSHTKIFFALNKELAKDMIKEWKDSNGQDLIDSYERKHILLVLSEKPSSTSLTTLEVKDKALSPLGGMLQMYLLKELLYNPAKHQLVPLHERMTEEEIGELLDKYMLKNRNQLPVILRSDVMARYLGLKQGEVVRITRYNETSGKYFYYRVCSAR